MLPSSPSPIVLVASGASALAAYALCPRQPPIKRILCAAGAGGLAFAVSQIAINTTLSPRSTESSAANDATPAAQQALASQTTTPVKRSAKSGLEDDLIEAAKGNPKAQFQLGVRYEHGRGVAKDAKLALEWFRKAADQGHADALNNLGAIYETGALVEKDEKKAVEYFQQSAALGSANGLFNLALCYARGHAVVCELKSIWRGERKTPGCEHSVEMRI